MSTIKNSYPIINLEQIAINLEQIVAGSITSSKKVKFHAFDIITLSKYNGIAINLNDAKKKLADFPNAHNQKIIWSIVRLTVAAAAVVTGVALAVLGFASANIGFALLSGALVGGGLTEMGVELYTIYNLAKVSQKDLDRELSRLQQNDQRAQARLDAFFENGELGILRRSTEDSLSEYQEHQSSKDTWLGRYRARTQHAKLLEQLSSIQTLRDSEIAAAQRELPLTLSQALTLALRD